MPVALAAFVAASCGAVASFMVNKFWAFRDPRPLGLPQIVGFMVVALGSAIGTALCVQVLSVGLGLPYLLAKAIGAVVLFLAWSYPVQSRLVFNAAH